MWYTIWSSLFVSSSAFVKTKLVNSPIIILSTFATLSLAIKTPIEVFTLQNIYSNKNLSINGSLYSFLQTLHTNVPHTTTHILLLLIYTWCDHCFKKGTLIVRNVIHMLDMYYMWNMHTTCVRYNVMYVMYYRCTS